MIASGTFPPRVHAETVHCAGLPRSRLDCDREIATQRLTCAGFFAGWVTEASGTRTTLATVWGVADAACAPGPLAAGESLTLAGVAVVDGLAVFDGVAVLDGLADFVAVAVFDGVGVGVGSWVGIGVFVAVAEAEAVGFGVPVVETEPVGVGVPVGLVAEPVGEGVPVVGLGDGLECVGFGVGDRDGVGVGVGLGAGDLTTAHARPLLDEVTADVSSTVSGWPDCAAAAPTAAATSNPVAAARKTPPAARVTVTGRACVKRMNRPYQCSFGTTSCGSQHCLVRYVTIGYQ
jgi:hypothetical protein